MLDCGPIQSILDSSCTAFLTESHIKILHVYPISDSALSVARSTLFRFIHGTEPFCVEKLSWQLPKLEN